MKDLRLAKLSEARSVFNLKGTVVGSREIVLMGGPCAVESAAQIHEAARVVKEAGGQVLRGGVFKPRTSPYSFQGLGELGLNYLLEAAREQGLLAVTEAIDAESLELVKDKVDLIQIGARNMQNFQLLKLAGRSNKPIILKRGLAATIEEWLYAAEYILAAGNPQVILCERGIRTFETATRNTLDLSAVLVAKELSHLPVIVDPSHAAGRTDIIDGLTKAAIAAGADGLLIEMHPNPAEAVSDGAQSLNPEQFKLLASQLGAVANSVNRTFSVGTAEQDSLTSLRSRIDLIDLSLVELLAQRMQVVQKIAGQKSMNQIKDPKREKEIMQRLRTLADTLACPSDLVEKLYTLIFEYAIQIQSKTAINKEPVA